MSRNGSLEDELLYKVVHKFLIGIIFGGSNCLLVSLEIAFNKTDYLLKGFSGGPEKRKRLISIYTYIPYMEHTRAMQNYIEVNVMKCWSQVATDQNLAPY